MLNLRHLQHIHVREFGGQWETWGSEELSGLKTLPEVMAETLGGGEGNQGKYEQGINQENKEYNASVLPFFKDVWKKRNQQVKQRRQKQVVKLEAPAQTRLKAMMPPPLHPGSLQHVGHSSYQTLAASPDLGPCSNLCTP